MVIMLVRKMIFLCDPSIESLFCFLIEKEFLKADCENLKYTEWVNTVVNFVEGILNHNGMCYQNKKDPLTFSEIATYFAANKPRTPTTTPTQSNSYRNFQNRNSNQAKLNQGTNSNSQHPKFNPNGPKGQKWMYTKEEIENKRKELCPMWNREDNITHDSMCKNPFNSSTGKCKDSRGVERLHRCDWQYLFGDKSYCCGSHPKFKHKRLERKN